MTTKDMIHFEDWKKLDIRVGKITKIKDHPNADKLYVLTIDFGPELGERTIVAGLKEYCTSERLEGKSAIFIINLEPKKIRGVESNSMILAAISSNELKGCVLVPDSSDIEPGSKIS